MVLSRPGIFLMELIRAEGGDSDDHLNFPHRTKQKVKAKPTTVDNGNFFSSLLVEDASDADETTSLKSLTQNQVLR
jgi:hypothetical protein